MDEQELKLRGIYLSNETKQVELERLTARPGDNSVNITITRKGDGKFSNICYHDGLRAMVAVN
ncbi:hypothetical protein P8886_21520 [Bacillus haynesii]|nr:hypothetical protein [Bacillus haynesii]